MQLILALCDVTKHYSETRHTVVHIPSPARGKIGTLLFGHDSKIGMVKYSF